MNTKWNDRFLDINKDYLFKRERLGLRIPFFLYTSQYELNFILNDNLIIETWAEDDFKLNKELENIKEKLITPEKENYSKRGDEWYNDALCRLSDIKVNRAGEGQIVKLYFQKTFYEDHFVSNINLNESVLKSGKNTIREIYAPHIEDITYLKNSKLANPLGTSTFIINPTDKKGFIGTRSEFVVFHKGYYAIAGGHMLAEKYLDFEDGKPNPFLGALREAQNEFHDSIRIEDMKCLGIGVDLMYGHPNILFLAVVDLKLEDIINFRQKERKEFSNIFEIDLNIPSNLFKYLDLNKISANNATCAILSAEYLFPELYLGGKKGNKGFLDWKNDHFNTNYFVTILRKINKKGRMIINNDTKHAIDLTEQLTEMCELMVSKLYDDKEKNDSFIGYVSYKEFKEYVTGWVSEDTITQTTGDNQVKNQINRLKVLLKKSIYPVGLIESIEGEKKVRLSTFPDRVKFKKESSHDFLGL